MSSGGGIRVAVVKESLQQFSDYYSRALPALVVQDSTFTSNKAFGGSGGATPITVSALTAPVLPAPA